MKNRIRFKVIHKTTEDKIRKAMYEEIQTITNV